MTVHLEDLTRRDLAVIAGLLHLPGRGHLRKDQLIPLVREALGNAPTTTAMAPAIEDHLEARSLRELRMMAADQGVVGRHALSKSELIEALRAIARSSADGEAPTTAADGRRPHPAKLDELPLSRLCRLAAQHGIGNWRKLRRDELTAAIRTALGVPPGQDLVVLVDEDGRALPTGPATTASLPVTSPAASLTPKAPSKPTALPTGPAANPAHGDPGLPIPQTYGRDRVVLMVQDPHHLFAYWEATAATVAKAEAAGGPAVLVVHGPSGTSEQRTVDLDGGNYYLTIGAPGTYRADLAVQDRSSGALTVLASSKPVETPRGTISPTDDAQWLRYDETIIQLLSRTEIFGHELGSSATLSAWSERLHERILSRLTLVDKPGHGMIPTGIEALDVTEVPIAGEDEGEWAGSAGLQRKRVPRPSATVPPTDRSNVSSLPSSHSLSSRALSSRSASGYLVRR